MNDNFQCIYKILKTLEAAMDYPEFDISQISHEKLEISKYRWACYLEMMLDSGYIKGLKIFIDVTGEICVHNEGIKITFKGLEFLTENYIMQRIHKKAMGVVQVVSALKP